MLAWHTAVAAWMSYVSPHISLESHRSLTAVSPHGSRPSPLPAARHPILTFLLTLPLPLLSRRRTACVALEIHLEINLELTLEPTLQIGGDHPADHPADRPVDASGDPAVEIARLPPRGSSVARFAPHRSPPPSPTPPVHARSPHCACVMTSIHVGISQKLMTTPRHPSPERARKCPPPPGPHPA